MSGLDHLYLHWIAWVVDFVPSRQRWISLKDRTRRHVRYMGVLVYGDIYEI